MQVKKYFIIKKKSSIELTFCKKLEHNIQIKKLNKPNPNNSSNEQIHYYTKKPTTNLIPI